MGGCGCECNCCAACVYGDCWGACCICPPPTCGCGETILAGETCLNTSYYLVGPNINQSGSPVVYWQFDFGYCIMVPPTSGTFNENIYQLISWYYNLEWLCLESVLLIPSGYYITSGIPPSGIQSATPGYAGSAQNCFVWPDSAVSTGNGNPFTSYSIVGCNSGYPEQQYGV